MTTGLILVDIQNDYFPGGRAPLVGMDAASLKAKALLSTFRKQRLPTFHIQHVAKREGATFFLPDTAGVEIHEIVQPLPDDRIIRKHYPNSFRETSLLDRLKDAGVDRVVICGAMSHMCIDATTRAAADFGFACIVIHDACATKDLTFKASVIPAASVHVAFMAALGSGYANVMGSDEYISSGTAGTIGRRHDASHRFPPQYETMRSEIEKRLPSLRPN